MVITIRVLGKSFTLKNESGSEKLVAQAQKLQSVIDNLEQQTTQMSRDKLLVLAALELAQVTPQANTVTQDKIDLWTAKLTQLCDTIDLKVRENL